MLHGISLEGERIAIRAPFKYKDAIKELPGATWSKAASLWQLPATPSAARNVQALFDGKPVPQSPDFRALAARYENIEASNARKYAEQLPPVPNEKLPSWLHQKQAFWYAYNMPATMLEMGMGTGKTKVIIDLVREWRCRRVLIICPNKVQRVWPKEFAKHGVGSGRLLVLDEGTVADKAARFKQVSTLPDTSPLIVVAGYDAAWREPLSKLLQKAQWDCILLDESHKAKSASGKRGKYIATLDAPRKLCLTGTPNPHDILDTFSQYRFLDVGIYGKSYTLFKKRYAVLGGFKNYEVKGWQNEEEFRQRYESICYTVSSDVLDLPPVQHIELPVTLTTKTLKHYNELEQELITEVKAGMVTADNALVKLLRLHQLTSGYLVAESLDGKKVETEIDTEKADTFAEWLDGIPQAEPVTVFCLFRHDIDTVLRIGKEQGRKCAELSGRVNDLEEASYPKWANLLAVQIQAGGVGVDLTRSAYACYYSVGFNGGDYEQSLARIHRPGQERPSFYYHLVAGGTVDVDVYAALTERKSAVARILGRYAK